MIAGSALVLVVSLAGADPAAPVPAVVGAPPPPAPPAAAAAAANAPALALPPAAVDRALKYRMMVDATRQTKSEDAYCKLLDEATATAQALEAPLSARRLVVWEDLNQLDAFTKAVEQLSSELPGIHLHVGAEVLYAQRDDAVLASRAPSLAAEDLLGAAAPLLVEWPPWLEQATDVQACARPERAAVAIHRLRNAWDAGPTCLRDRMKKDLQRSFQRLAATSWFCDDEKNATAAVESAAQALDVFDAVKGAQVAKQLRARVKAKDVHFGRTPPPVGPAAP